MQLSTQSHPNFSRVISQIESKSKFQRKAINRLLENAQGRYFDFAEDFVQRLIRALDREEAVDYLATSYLNYTKHIRIEEMHFIKDRKYRADNFANVYREVYSRDEYMYDYVVGLGMTQLFWPNHWAIVSFFLDEFIPLIKESKRGAEVGCGHGLFHAELLKYASNLRTTLIDISPTSLNMTVNMVKATGVDSKRVTIANCDIQKENPLEDDSLDVLLMGEIIEHLEDGEKVMAEMCRKMKPGGVCYFTTAANAPAEDHLLLFRTAGEIRDFLNTAGWRVVKEHLGTLNNISVEEAEADGHNINYAAIITVEKH